MKFSSLFERPKYTLTGRDIYVDKKDRLIYYNKRTKQGYVVADDQANSFRTFRSRYLLGLCAFALIQIALFNNYFISVGIGVAVTLVLAFRYKKLLNQIPMIQNYDISKATCTRDLPPELPIEAIVLRVVLFLVLAILLVINLYTAVGLADELSTVAITYIAALGSVYFAIKHVLDFNRQSKAQKK